MRGDNASSTFDCCCSDLENLMQREFVWPKFVRLIWVGKYDGLLYMAVNVVELSKGRPPTASSLPTRRSRADRLYESSESALWLISQPVFFCPFCGTELQTPEDVDAKQARVKELTAAEQRKVTSWAYDWRKDGAFLGGGATTNNNRRG